MHAADAFVIAQVRTGIARPGHEGEKPLRDERGKRPLEDRPQVVIHRTELEHYALAVRDEHRQRVERPYGRHVAGPKYQRRSTIGLGCGPLAIRPGTRGRLPRLDPDLATDAPVHHPVKQRTGKDAGHGTSARADVQGDGLRPLHGVERVSRQAESTDRGHRPGQPLFASKRRRRIDPLGPTSQRHPLVADRQHAGGASAQQLRSRVDIPLPPDQARAPHPFDDPVQAGPIQCR
jgi:hypothetical protein